MKGRSIGGKVLLKILPIISGCLCLIATGAAAQQEATSTFEAGQQALASGDPWEARGLFERALREGYPPAPGYLAVADAYLALDNRLFFAREALESSLRADPDNISAWLRLAEVNLRLEGGDSDPRAREAFHEVFRRDPFFEDAYAQWSRMFLSQEDQRIVSDLFAEHLRSDYEPDLALRRIDVLYDGGYYDLAWEALEEFRRKVRREEYLARFSYYAGVVQAARGENAQGGRYYFNGLAFAVDEKSLSNYYSDVEPLLSEEQKETWKEMTVDARVQFLRGWWNQRDPLPLDEVNDRWVEQQERIRIAREAYKWDKPIDKDRLVDLGGRDSGRPVVKIRLDGRSLDDRGAFFLRHGRPENQSGPGIEECGFWYYNRPGLPKDHEVGVNFTRGAALGGGMGDAPALPRGQFIGNDCNFTTIPQTALSREFNVVRDQSDVSRAQQRALQDMDSALSTDTQRDEIENRIPVDLDPINFSYYIEDTDVAMYFAIPLGEIDLHESRSRYRKGLVLYDEEWNEITRRAEDMEAAIAHVPESDGDSGEWYLVDLFRVRITPGQYNFALQVNDLVGDGVGVIRGAMRVRHFRPTGLQMSDPVLSGGVIEGGKSPRFQRHGWTVVPVPSRRFLKHQPLYLYFETYNLLSGDDGQLDFRIEYTIRAEKIDRGAVEKFFGSLRGLVGVEEEEQAITLSFERSAPAAINGRIWPEYVSFDASALEPGVYTLEIVVTDHAFHDRQATQVRTFTIRD